MCGSDLIAGFTIEFAMTKLCAVVQAMCARLTFCSDCSYTEDVIIFILFSWQLCRVRSLSHFYCAQEGMCVNSQDNSTLYIRQHGSTVYVGMVVVVCIP